MLLELLMSTIGTTIAESVFSVWWQGTSINKRISEIIKDKTDDLVLGKNVQRNFEELGDKIAVKFQSVFENYMGSHGQEVNYQSIAYEVTSAIKASHVSLGLLSSLNHNPSKLSSHILSSYEIPKLTFNDREASLYRRSIDLASQYIIDLSAQLPNFTKDSFMETLTRLGTALNKLDSILDEIQVIRDAVIADDDRERAEFEEDYRKAIIRKFNRINLFGIDIDRKLKRYNLTTAYVSLKISSQVPTNRKLPEQISSVASAINLCLEAWGWGINIIRDDSKSIIFDYKMNYVGLNMGRAIAFDNPIKGNYVIFSVETSSDEKIISLFEQMIGTLDFPNVNQHAHIESGNSLKYIDENLGFSIQYPESWLNEPTFVSLGYEKITAFYFSNDEHTQSIWVYIVNHKSKKTGKVQEIKQIQTELTQYTVNVESALSQTGKIAIIGEAGSGKTTLLQWLAVNTASNRLQENYPELKHFKDKIPFCITLREYQRYLPTIEDFIKNIEGDIATIKPNRWIHDTFKSGRAILLIDGLDEVLVDKRQSVLNWLEEILSQYPRLSVVFTSRPAAYKYGWLNQLGFKEYLLVPMDYSNIKLFIQYWHDAVLIDQELESDSTVKLLVDRLVERLIHSNPLMRLATNPLLCSMICALHYNHNTDLPTEKITLYNDCISALIQRRDLERDIKFDNDPNLTYQEKVALLDDLAYWSMKNGYTVFPLVDAQKRLSQKISNMHLRDKNININTLMRFLIERSGILREPIPGSIDFIHKTFQEYMAARDAAKENDWGLLLSHASDDSWQETIILSVGFANIHEASYLINNLLDKSSESNGVKSYYYNLLAISCLEHAMEITPTTRNRVEQILHKLIPPIDERSSIYLASAGDLAISYLSYNSSYTDNECISCITTLQKIGTSLALKKLGEYIFNQREKVIRAVDVAIRNFTTVHINSSGLANQLLKSLADRMLDNRLKISGDLLYAISGVESDKVDKYLPDNLESLAIYDFVPSNDYFFFHIKNLRELIIDGNLEQRGKIPNLQALKKAKVKSLSLIHRGKGGWKLLEQLNTIRTITSLDIGFMEGNMPNFRSLDNDKINLKKLAIWGFNSFNINIDNDILTTIQHLTKLTHVHLSGSIIPDLEPLKYLYNLEKLELSIWGKYSVDVIFGIEELQNLKYIVINTKRESAELKQIKKGLEIAFPTCKIQLNVNSSIRPLPS